MTTTSDLPTLRLTSERINVPIGLIALALAVLSAVQQHEMGKASGVNFMAQRLGAVFAIAIASTVFAARGNLSNPAAVTAGFRRALWSCVIFAALAALSSIAIVVRPHQPDVNTDMATDVPVAA